jgi:hypothetical protein
VTERPVGREKKDHRETVFFFPINELLSSAASPDA